MFIIYLMSHEVSAELDVTELVAIAEFNESQGAQALAEFQAFMAENGNIIVESARLPGVPLPLNALMNACPEPVTEKNAHKFLAEAQSLVQAASAKELQKTEDEKEEDSEDEAEPEEDAKKKLI